MSASPLELFVSFAKVGTFAWGGGPAMIPLMQDEFVEKKAWMNDEQFLDALAAGYALPGPIATKMAIYVGYDQGSYLGALTAVLGMILPSAVLIAVVIALLHHLKDNPRVEGMLGAIRPVVLGMLVYMVIRVAPESVGGWKTGALAALTVGLLLLRISPIWMILGAGLLGVFVHVAD